MTPRERAIDAAWEEARAEAKAAETRQRQGAMGSDHLREVERAAALVRALERQGYTIVALEDLR